MNAPAPIGQTLLQLGLISADQLHIALREQHRSGDALGRQLVRLGFLSEATLRDALAQTLSRESIDLTHVLPDPAALALVPQPVAKRLKLIPLSYDAARPTLVIASAEIDNLIALDQLRSLLPAGSTIDTLLAGDSEIARAIDQLYGHELSIDGILHEIETGEPERLGAASAGNEYAQPVVRLIDALLADAVRRDASDLHFEPEAGFLRIRYRIDGMLRQIRALHRACWPAMAVRLKVMAGLNIAETRAPQDGRISLHVSGRPVDFRVSTLPTLHGENIVLRILDRQKGLVRLDQLGLADAQLDLLKLMIARPEGLILVTGPTGSGKTTTLYSILGHLNAEGVNIMTLEDPVEYPMPQIRQTAVSEATRLDFANGVRAMLRQDPDVILVGEIRDEDTARMAFQAAMTGHQVFSTLHTSSAIGAIPRLLDIGIQPDILAGNIIGVVAQRLVRRLCPACRDPHPADDIEMRLLALGGSAGRPVIHRPKGCPRCDFQGYLGRLAIMEVLRLDGDLDELVARRATTREIRQAALHKGFRTLADDGCRRVLEGETSLEELSRVVDLTDRLSP
ncbi:type II secretion system protein E [Zoogloea oryzae]|uniref:Type II secretion system protein E n=1 Tax=Zoogloea oryzae TaxID=310767 RepID=A0ABQ6FCE9_9RHOO|nr:type II/IV secretion system protein [Zoogloea oryzae]GLT23242.1 type II secretion system protein E [Zoogloea oryzae]